MGKKSCNKRIPKLHAEEKKSAHFRSIVKVDYLIDADKVYFFFSLLAIILLEYNTLSKVFWMLTLIAYLFAI